MTEPTAAWSPGEPGRVLSDRYRLESRIGGGAVAEVYRAVDERLARPVAVKLFRGDAAEQLQRHEAEMRTLASLDHPSLVTVYDAGEDTGQPYLVMQLVEGHTLADELRRGVLEQERTARYGAALADALAYVHERGFVHRDVKPANVLIAEDGRVHLADFGIARLVDSAHVTRTGEVLGTPAYFAPEQVSGDPVGAAADVYALGIILIECLTGRRPFEGTAMEVAMARLSRDPELPPTMPDGWRSVLAAMTARESELRPDASRVAAALRDLAAGNADRTVVMAPATGPTATQVLPPTAAMTRAAYATSPGPAAPPAPLPAAPVRRRSPRGVLIALLVLIIVAGAAIGIALTRNNTSSSFTPGKPALHQPLEDDVQQLEKLVRR